jgi:uncharacterized protein (TIGR03435 family)
MSTDDGMLNYSNLTLKDVIAQAYRIAKYQVAGPAWLDDDHFVIAAKIPSGAPREQVPAMLQTLLKERFGLEFHRESKDMAVFALVVAKGGSKLKATDSATGCHISTTSRKIRHQCHMDLSQFAERLSTYTDRPVVDKTQLPGVFEINIEWVPDGAATVDAEAGSTLLEALPEQLGLRLEAQRAPVEMLTVDSANRVPSEN